MEHVGAPKESSPTPRSARARGSASRAPVAPLPASAVALARMDGATQVTVARTLQQRAGNAAALRYLARAPSPLKQKVDQARRTNPREFVLKAVREMPAAPQKWTIGEQTAEIVWRMIWMFLPERISRTGVQTDAKSRGVEPKWNTRRDAMTLVVGPDFIKDVTNANLDNRITILRLVFLEKDALIEKLKADFGFAAVTDGSSNWTVGELAETYAGLARLSQAERRVLAGVTLRRQANITENGRQFDGEFEWDVSAVAGGSETAPDLTQTLKMADSAFVDPDRASWVVVHEVGHAVDSDKRRRARLAAGVAIAAENKTINTLNGARQAATAALNAGIRSANRYRAPDRAAANGFITAMRATHNAIEAFASSTSANAAARERAADAAVTARNAARGRLPNNSPADGDFATACDLQDDALIATRAFVTARAAKVTARNAVSAASGASNARISLRLERFRAIVLRHNIAPITPYARQNWPAQPEEFFAEAFSMWRHDPTRLERLARPLKAFFDAGDHLK